MQLFKYLAAAVALITASAALAQDRPRIVVVNYPLQYLTERLVGDAADVVFPMPAGVDPSFWRPGISDISAIQSADLILLNGAGFASWVDRVSLPRSRLVNTSSAIKDRFIHTESITHSHGDGGEHSHDGVASYTWLDPTLAIGQAETIALALAGREFVPVQEVEDRLAALRTELEALDTEAKAALSAAQDIAIIATHPRYQYFARRYGLSVTSLEWDAGAMPTGEERAELEARVKETGARIMIWEAAPPDAAGEAAAALGLASVTFNPMAHQDGDRDFQEAFSSVIKALAEAAAQVAAE